MVSDTVRMDDLKNGTRVSVTMAAIRQRIAGRSLTSGDKLPSIRAFAGTMQVSTSTVVEAYDRLAAEGVIQSRPGSGFYVASQATPLALSEVGPKRDRAIDPFWVSRQSLEAGSADLKPGCGWLPPSWLPETACGAHCARCRAPMAGRSPNMMRRSDCRLCVSSSRGAWASAGSRLRRTRSC
jgi:DNA-binding transcriptional MocR family regulator